MIGTKWIVCMSDRSENAEKQKHSSHAVSMGVRDMIDIVERTKTHISNQAINVHSQCQSGPYRPGAFAEHVAKAAMFFSKPRLTTKPLRKKKPALWAGQQLLACSPSAQLSY